MELETTILIPASSAMPASPSITDHHLVTITIATQVSNLHNDPLLEISSPQCLIPDRKTSECLVTNALWVTYIMLHSNMRTHTYACTCTHTETHRHHSFQYSHENTHIPSFFFFSGIIGNFYLMCECVFFCLEKNKGIMGKSNLVIYS